MPFHLHTCRATKLQLLVTSSHPWPIRRPPFWQRLFFRHRVCEHRQPTPTAFGTQPCCLIHDGDAEKAFGNIRLLSEVAADGKTADTPVRKSVRQFGEKSSSCFDRSVSISVKHKQTQTRSTTGFGSIPRESLYEYYQTE